MVFPNLKRAKPGFAFLRAKERQTCGALTGAIMGVCCVVGRERLEDKEQEGIGQGRIPRDGIPFFLFEYLFVEPFSLNEDGCADDEKGEDQSEEDIIF